MVELSAGPSMSRLNQPITVALSAPLNACSVCTPLDDQVPAFQSSLPATVGLTCPVCSALPLPLYASSGTRMAAPPLTSSISVPERPWSCSRAASPATGWSKS